MTMPTLILTSQDDPVVPVVSFSPYQNLAGHPVRFEYTSSGGNVEFWHCSEPRYWATEAVLDFIEAETNADPGR
jgi:predicted alpha/beta-fold hydrolase